MKKTFVVFLMMSGASAALLCGCAAKTTTADVMRGYATELQTQVDLKTKLAKDWERGSNLVESGNKLVKSGNKRVSDGEQQIKKGQEAIQKGNEEIAEGTRLIQESEKLFNENFPDLGLNVGK